MLDKRRILAKLDELAGYLDELEEVRPRDFEDYGPSTQKKRANERLLQISIECVIDISSLIVKGKSLGLPNDEDDIFDKLGRKEILTKAQVVRLKRMKGFRNILVHRYGTIDDMIVYQFLTEDIEDFQEFKKQVKKAIK